jgi:hypothetical protein
VRLRLRRQQVLLGDEGDPTRLLAVLDEAAVRRARAFGQDEEGRDQLLHLREVSRRRNVSVRIVPLSTGLHPGVMGSFNVYQFSDDIDRDVVLIESRSGDRYLEEQSSVLDHLRLFDAINSSALDNADSRILLDRLADAPLPSEEKK